LRGLRSEVKSLAREQDSKRRCEGGDEEEEGGESPPTRSQQNKAYNQTDNEDDGEHGNQEKWDAK
jgi:hypothetical protein